jgi:hypothetical protein
VANPSADRLVLMVQSPRWLFAYWDMTEQTRLMLTERGVGRADSQWSRVLRLYDTTHQDLVDELVPQIEMILTSDARDTYFQIPAPGRRYVAELGYAHANGEFIQVARSHAVDVPRPGPAAAMAGQAEVAEGALRLSLTAPVGGSSGELGMGSQELYEHLASGASAVHA